MLLGASMVAAMTANAVQAQDLTVNEIAPGLFFHQGVHAEADQSNLGAIANIGFIVGKKCVAVVDSGGSHENGLQLRNAIRAVTDLPVCYVINTHVHPDHVYGNSAFLGDAPKYVGHERLPDALTSREPFYAKSLARAIGSDKALRSKPVPPDVMVKDRLSIDLGDRVVEIKAWPTAHTNTDVTVFDLQTRTLWAGDLLFEQRAPSLDGSLIGWLAVMENLRKIPAARVIPGHGKISTNWPAALDAQHEYLSSLRDDVRAAIKDNRSLRQTVEQLGGRKNPSWLLFPDYHPHNVTVAFTELEWED